VRARRLPRAILSSLRGLALWLGKPGLVRKPEHFGMRLDGYRRHEAAEHDRYVGAQLAVMRALGLRRKEAVMLRPHACTVPVEALGRPESERAADFYVRIKAGAKRGRMRLIPLDLPLRLSAMARAEAVAEHAGAHLGNPSLDLKQNLRRAGNQATRCYAPTGRCCGCSRRCNRQAESIDALAAEAAHWV